VSVGMDVVGVMAAYLPWCVCVLHCLERHCPSSGSFIQCLAKITVMVLSCPLTWM